jgi:hypothetical protein
MSKVFADEYKKMAAGDAPDLWARIEAGIDEIAENAGIRTARDVDFAVEEPETVKLEPMSYVNRHQFLYRYGGLIAACLCAAVIAPLIYFARGISYESASTGTGALQNIAETTTAGVEDRLDIAVTGEGADWMTDNAPAPLPEESGGSGAGEYDEAAKAEQGFELAESPAAAMTDAQNQGGQAGDGNRDMMTNAGQAGGMAYGHSTYTTANDFEMRLFTDKEVYRSGEQIMVRASLEYVGANDSATIWDEGGQFMFFIVTDDENFRFYGQVLDFQKERVLQKGKVYSYSYDESGSWDMLAEDDAYWGEFFDKEGLQLPPGEYTVTVSVYALDRDWAMVPGSMKCELKIRVE